MNSSFLPPVRSSPLLGGTGLSLSGVSRLEQGHWKVSSHISAAQILGLDRSTMRARMRKPKISKP
jgi:hypothetical protein